EKAKSLQIPITKYKYIENGYINQSDIDTYKTPIVVKSINESGGRNTSYYEDKTSLSTLLLKNQIIESYVNGTEYSVEMLVQNGKIIFSNITMYNKKYTQNILPATLPERIKKTILDYSTKIVDGFGIKNSLCHAEFYVHGDAITFGEIAIRPPGGYIMNLLEMTYKSNFWKLFIEIQTMQAITPPISKNPTYSAVWIIHPGQGRVNKIEGWESIQSTKGYAGGRLKIHPGDICKMRLGSGQDYGYIFFTDKCPESLIKRIETAEELLKVDIDNDPNSLHLNK
ncbi:MAG: ATP-grasp domain-containing protein, partial [Bdellovibrionales bacterium]|nr:ATP-grasp domain-containing protein [Bdellovibrionales bacterium]